MTYCAYLSVESGSVTRFFPVVAADAAPRPDQPVMYLNLVAVGAPSPAPPTVTLTMEASPAVVIPYQGASTDAELDSPTIAGFLGVTVTYGAVGPQPSPGAGESRFQLRFFLSSGSLDALRATTWSIQIDAAGGAAGQSFSWVVTDSADDSHAVVVPALTARRATVTGPATLSGGVANTVLLAAGATAAAGQHIAVSGDGLFKHGVRTINIPVSQSGRHDVAFRDPPLGVPTSLQDSLFFFVSGVPVGARIASVRVTFMAHDAGNKLRLVLKKKQVAQGAATWTAIPPATGVVSTGAGAQVLALNDLNFVVTSSTELAVLLFHEGAAAAMTIWAIDLDYDQP